MKDQTVQKKSLSLSVLMPVFNERYLVTESLNRVLALKSEWISRLEVIIVDDQSTDGSWEVLQKAAQADDRITLIRHEKNSGKGAAVQTALQRAAGEITVIQDADLEYNPEDIPRLMEVFLKEGCDAVFGTRYLSSAYRSVLLYKHSLINKCITAFVNFLTDLDLTDVETCYKAIRTSVFKSIPIRSRNFNFEIEITMKLARRKANIFEVPIRYIPRTHEEGKKIRFRDGIWALMAGMYFFAVEDIYHKKGHGLRILLDLNNARRFNRWMAATLRPFVGDRVLELGAGIGNLSKHFIPRELYVVSDIDSWSLGYLESYSYGKHYFHVRKIDAGVGADFEGLENTFDTVLMINLLEHVQDDRATLKILNAVLEPGGRVVILVPQHPSLFGSFDQVLEHRERYTRKKLRAVLEETGFEMDRMFDFNRITVPSWFLNGKILRRKRFSLVQLKILELMMPIVRHVDRFLPWPGLSLIAVGVKKTAANS